MSITKRRRRVIWLAAAILFFPLLGLLQQLAASHQPDPQLARQLRETPPPAVAGGVPVLCLGGVEFMAALGKDLATARHRVLVQTLSFEGDAAGEALTEALLACPAAEKALIIDSYARWVQSDMLVGSPLRLFNFGLYREKARMLGLVERLRENGVKVVFGRPYGFGKDNLAARDHKKMCVVDDVVYLGGINFSQHNFLWRDLMLRLENPQLAEACARDFFHSQQGESRPSLTTGRNFTLVSSPGEGRTDIIRHMTRVVDQAQSEIYLECPYITEPLFSILATARRRGVQVTIVTSEDINRFGMKWSILGACVEHDFKLRLWPHTMTHVKALLVDDRELVLGSANFDFLSGELQPELMLVTRDSTVISQFIERVQKPSLTATWDWSAQGQSSGLAPVGRMAMGLARVVLEQVHRRK